MQIRAAEFVVGAVSPADLPGDRLPEVAFAGRSNVGKSSLINRLAGRKQLAFSGARPGKTQQLNYYRIDDWLYLVDLPGYGFVSGGAELRGRMGKLASGFVEGRQELRAVVQLVDARHDPTELDWRMLELLKSGARPFLLVFTKIDKLSQQQLRRQLEQLEAGGQLTGCPFVLFSARTGEGRDDVWEWIQQQVGMHP